MGRCRSTVARPGSRDDADHRGQMGCRGFRRLWPDVDRALPMPRGRLALACRALVAVKCRDAVRFGVPDGVGASGCQLARLGRDFRAFEVKHPARLLRPQPRQNAKQIVRRLLRRRQLALRQPGLKRLR